MRGGAHGTVALCLGVRIAELDGDVALELVLKADRLRIAEQWRSSCGTGYDQLWRSMPGHH